MVGATEPLVGDKTYDTFRQLFKRHNYFTLKNRLLIIKISRSKRPFWGVGKDFIDLLNKTPTYNLVLLVSSREGWVFSKDEVNANIRSEKWKLRETDNNYKINLPLPDLNTFAGAARFYEKLGITQSTP